MPQDSFEFFLGRENAKKVELLEKNHDVAEALMGALDRLVEHCNEKGVRFEDLSINGPDSFIHGNYVRLSFRFGR